MIYQYRCTKCANEFEVIKSMNDSDRNEFCGPCGSPAEYIFSPNVQFSKSGVTHAEYNPGLGTVVKNRHHRAELCKQKGLIEIGSDYKHPDNFHNEFEKKREEKRNKRWEDA